MGVVGRIEEVLTVELTEGHGEKDVADGNSALRMGSLNGLEARESALIIEVVEVHEGIADFGSEVDGVGVGSRVVGLRVSRGRQQEGEEVAEDFHAAFYDSSPYLGNEALRELVSILFTL